MRWEHCVSHRAERTEAFIRDFFGKGNRTPFLIGGAGFDPRATLISKLMAQVVPKTVRGMFIREERPAPAQHLIKAAERNADLLKVHIPKSTFHSCPIIDPMDNAPKGGREVAKILDKSVVLTGVTDIVLDCSALSASVFFAIAKFCDDAAKSNAINFHIMVQDDPAADSDILANICGTAALVHPFQGNLWNEKNATAAKLWIPQLGRNRHAALELIYNFFLPTAVCPVLPFPARHPRYADSLVEEYAQQILGRWEVDARDFVYAHESNPVDLYRTLLRIDDARQRVFASTTGSHIVLSPLGNKALAVGMLMACLERDFSVVSVEALGYEVDEPTLTNIDTTHCEAIHVWIAGEAYAKT